MEKQKIELVGWIADLEDESVITEIKKIMQEAGYQADQDIDLPQVGEPTPPYGQDD